MGRVIRWLKGLISGGAGGERRKKKKNKDKDKDKDRDKWGNSPFPFPLPFVTVVGDRDVDEKNRHAVAIAEATAAAAEAAVTAAQAAAAVVRLTNDRVTLVSGRRKQDWAAVKIQAVFRGYLARRALKALKGLVKLQALVRGHIVRKQALETLRCMQALVRAQSRALSSHAHTQQSPPMNKRSHNRILCQHNRNGSNSLQSCGWTWLDCCMEERYWDSRETLSRTGMMTDEEKSEMIRISSKSRSKQYHHSDSHSSFTSEQYSRSHLHDSPSKNSTVAQHSIPSPPSVNMQKQSLNPSHSQTDEFCQSPHFYSASSWTGSSSRRRGPFTPKTDGYRTHFNGYSDHPNYMSNTESFKAKVRSSSAPRQRPTDTEKIASISLKRSSVSSSSQTSSSLHTKFSRKAYPGSGRLHKMCMPPLRTQ